MMRAISRHMMGESPSDGSSIRITLGRDISARPMGEHLLLAAAQRAGELTGALLQPREALENILEIRAQPVRVLAQIGAHLQILAHRHHGKDPTPFRHMGDAEPGDSLGATRR